MKKLAFALFGALVLAGCETTSYSSGSYSGGSDGRNRVMNITNNTGVTMTHFYASNTGQRTWGPDQLGSTVMYSGSGRRINFDDGTGACMYDFKARFADGDVLITNSINVCVQSTWNYH